VLGVPPVRFEKFDCRQANYLITWRDDYYDCYSHKYWNDSPGNMVDSLRHQRTGAVSQTGVDDFGRACDHRGNFAFDRPIIAG